MRSFLSGIKNVLLWSYARGTWQYDVLCALIVLTLLFWPTRQLSKVAAVQAPTAGVAISGGGAVANGFQQRDIAWTTLRTFLAGQNKLDLLNSPQDAIVLFLQHETKATVTVNWVEPFADAQGNVIYRTRYGLD